MSNDANSPEFFNDQNAESSDDGDSDSDARDYYNYNVAIAPPIQVAPPIPARRSESDRPMPIPRKRTTMRKNDHQNVSSNSTSELLQATTTDGHARRPRNNYEHHCLQSPETNQDNMTPSNDYVEPPGALSNCPWYWGDISREDSEQMLKNSDDGYFLVRDSTTPGDYTLTVRKDGQSKCIKIYQNNGSFGLKSNEYNFSSLKALIDHYREHSLADFNRRLDTKLVSWPLRKRRSEQTDRYESLSALADAGRELHEVKQSYILLKQEQLEYSENLEKAQKLERAFVTAREMFSKLLTLSRNDLEVPETKKRMLQDNKVLASKKQDEIDDRLLEIQQCIRDNEMFHKAKTIEINSHVELLRDVEENCQRIKEQLLRDNAKEELVACLVEEVDMERTDSSLWLVECTREEAIELLKNEPAGTFLIRPRDEEHKPYALSIVSVNEDGTTAVKHCIILHPPGRRYGFREEGAVFNTVHELVCKHSKTSIKMYFSHMDTCLDHPLNGLRPRSFGDSSLSLNSFNQ